MSNEEMLKDALNGENAAYVAELYLQWAIDPVKVDPSFARLFESIGEDMAIIFQDALGASWQNEKKASEDKAVPFKTPSHDLAPNNPVDLKNMEAVSDSVYALHVVRAYRVNGHLEAQLDPLRLQRPQPHPDLMLQTYGFGEDDLDRPVFVGNSLQDLLRNEVTTIRKLHSALRSVYCGSIGAEFMHIQNVEQRRWLMHRLEKAEWLKKESFDKRFHILSQLTEAEAFEVFCQKKYVGTKRFGLEGGESCIVALHGIVDGALKDGVRSVEFGMAHRGRLNTLVNIIGKPFEAVFSELSGGSSQPDGLSGAGDVKYHLGAETTRLVGDHEVTVMLHPNPSHLEAVDPVVVGSVRAIQDSDKKPHSRYHHMGVIIHGDAAFSGQGVVYETMAMSQLIGYRTGGSIHVVINNQIGFTTVSAHAFSGQYCTDIAKSVQAPILHVNGDDPEAVLYCAQMAVEYRQRFSADIVLEIVCYRRHGHNEADEPSFTQPIMYQAIRNHPSTRSLYAERLIQEGLMTEAEVRTLWDAHYQKLEEAYKKVQNFQPTPIQADKLMWAGQGCQEEGHISTPLTGIGKQVIQRIGKVLNTVPEGFSVHPKILRQMEARARIFDQEGEVDWATAEALAFGSLLLEGARVRLSGEDCQRGTFSQRHAVLVDQKNQNEYMPLNNLAPHQAGFEVYNSLLSEFGVLGFEYGYSLFSPDDLVLWEAQFGDFSNGAQVVIDQFIASGESKWQRFSGLVMLLPHGYEGQGPEHSSARIERFLQLCAQNNMQVCMPTTPANYFHLLRRQLFQSTRKPLVIMTPKSLLRNPQAASPLSEMETGTAFKPVLEKKVGEKNVNRVVLCSGKVYYDLLHTCMEQQLDGIALIRLEQFFPFPFQEIRSVLAQYSGAEMVWCQEEPKNMGAWSFVEERLEHILVSLGRKEGLARGKAHSTRFAFAGRKASASPAAGLLSVHQLEQKELVEQALKH